MTTRPTAVRWIVALAWLRLVFVAMHVAIAFALLSPPGSEMMRGFRDGWLRGNGYAAATYGYYEAGEITGRAMIPALLAALMLVFVRRRKLTAMQVLAAVQVLLALAQPLSLLIAVPILVLTLRASTKAYCRAEPRPEVVPLGSGNS